jgi:acyl-CoA thioester hydrolase
MTFDAPLFLHHLSVRPEWIDYNGHMNVAYYLKVFDLAVDQFFNMFDLGEDYARQGGGSVFALEHRITYQRELKGGDPLRVTLQMMDMDRKRIHFFMRIYHATEGYLAATNENLSIHVDMKSRHSTPFPDHAYQKLRQLFEDHKTLPRPPEVGGTVGIRRRARKAKPQSKSQA